MRGGNMNNKINRSHLLVIVAVFCLIISGCLGGGITSDLPEIDLPEGDLPACETLYDSSLDWTNCQGTLTYPEGYKYVGEWKDGQFHGQGTLTYQIWFIPWVNGEYVGEWEDGHRHGQGTLTYANGTQLEGIWRNGNFLG